ncbi:unnamed protein product [Caretta caretta]
MASWVLVPTLSLHKAAPTSALGVTEWGSALTTAHTPVKLILQGKTSDIRWGSTKMGPVAYFSLCLLGCLIFNPSLEGIGATSCLPNWLLYQGHCYGYFLEKMTWSDAEMQCQYHRKGAHLASILTEAEGDRVARYISNSHSKDSVWIGLHDHRQYRRWRWTDRSQYYYKAWNTGEPNNDRGVEYCTELLNYRGFKNWNDKDCHLKNGYICKY